MVARNIRSMKFNFMQTDPITFTKLLLSNGDENLVKYMAREDTIEPIPKLTHEINSSKNRRYPMPIGNIFT